MMILKCPYVFINLKFISFLSLCALFISCEKKEAGVKPVLKSITESVYASTTVQPRDLYDLYASSTGIIEKLYVEEGDLIKREALIAKICSDREDINIEKAKLQLRLAEDKYKGSSNLLASIKNDIDVANMSFLQDSIDYVRQKTLWEQGVSSRSSYENQKLKYELSIEKLEGLV